MRHASSAGLALLLACSLAACSEEPAEPDVPRQGLELRIAHLAPRP